MHYSGQTPDSHPEHIDRNIWVLSATSFLTDISSEMLINLLPLFLANVLGVRTLTIGLIEGIAETTASLIKIISGRLSDRFATRKKPAVLGYAFSTLSKPLLYWASSWVGVLFVRFTDRVGKGIRTAPRDALLADSARPSQRGLAFGLHRAADTAGAFIGLLIAALIIFSAQGKTNLLTRSTFQTVVIASIIPAVLAVFILAFGAREVVNQNTNVQQTASGFAFYKQLDRRFYYFLLVVLIFTFGNSADAFIILRAQERGLTVLQIIGVLLSFTAVYALFSSPAGALSDRIGRRKVLLTGWVLYAAVYLGLALANVGWQVWLLYAIYGLFYALTEGTAKALVADLVLAEQRGTAYGLFNGAIGLAALPASLLAGLLWQGIGSWSGFGPAAPFLLGALLALAAAVLFHFWFGGAESRANQVE
jgi:MFS family permease